jgi:hypothetical protein
MTERDDDIRWFALLIRRICLTAVIEIERRFDLPVSVIPRDQRERKPLNGHHPLSTPVGPVSSLTSDPAASHAHPRRDDR